MSDLKHQTLRQLNESKGDCEQHITALKSSLSGQQERLKWIDHYIVQNTVKEMTITEIEQKLGHKVILK